VGQPEHLRDGFEIQLQGEVAEVARLNPELIDRTYIITTRRITSGELSK
jgi:hypothetical protein